MILNSTNPVARAVDVGYGNTKFVIDPNIWSPDSCQLFPSIALPAQADGDGIARRDTLVVRHNDQAYEVGRDAHLLDSSRAGALILHENYTNTPQYRALVGGALLKMAIDKIDLLVVGLPVKFMSQKRDTLRVMLIGEHDIGGRYTAVDNVLVLPQPLGSLIYHVHQQNLFPRIHDQTCLVIDQGFFTTDWLVTEGLKPMPARCGSAATGMSVFLKEIARRLTEQTGTPFQDLRAIDKSLQRGCFRLFGKPVDLTPLVASAKHVFAPLVDELVNAVGSASHVDRIILSGGGAPFILEPIQAAFPHHALSLVPNPAFANVKGFQLAGNDLLARRQLNKGAA